MPLAEGDSDRLVDASMHVNPSEASPGEFVTFWILIYPRDEEVRRVVVTEALPNGLSPVSTSIPGLCEEQIQQWTCNLDDEDPFAIEIRVVVEAGTEGQELVSMVRVEAWGDDEDRDLVTVHAGILIVPTETVEEPDLQVRLSAVQDAFVPGGELNYRIELTNHGEVAAGHVTVVVSFPAEMVLLSASPWPLLQEGGLTWLADSVPAGSHDFLFNLTAPAAGGLTEIQVTAAVTYGDGQGHDVRIESMPFTLRAVPGASEGLGLLGLVVAVVGLAGGALLIIQRAVGLPLPGWSGAEEIFLLHRSGLVLRHFSAHPAPGKDSDIVGGMMAAVRMFVEHSMSPYAGHLREIRFGGGSIVFVNGENVTLAAVNPRGGTAGFADRAMRFLRQFERANGGALTNFDGVAGALAGVDVLFRRFALGSRILESRPAPETGDVPRQ